MGESYVLNNGQILLDHGFEQNAALWVEGSTIKKIIYNNQALPPVPIIDLKNKYLAPALIDLQVNGFEGVSLNPEMSLKNIFSVHEALIKQGCCSYLPTLISAPFSEMKRALLAVESAMNVSKSAVLGIHFEGPYINPLKKGIHDERHIRGLLKEELNYWCERAKCIGLMTLAPEQVSHHDIEKLSASGIALAAGHSNATYTEAKNGFKSGIVAATHLFNAMSSLESREPGLVGAILEHQNIFTCCIPDGHHVSWPSLKIAINSINKEKICFVTDALTGAHSSLQSFSFAGKNIFVQKGFCCDATNRLAGSTLSPIEGVKNAVNHLGLPLSFALHAFSKNPAKLLNRACQLGTIRPGAFANLIILEKDLTLDSVIFEGSLKAF